MGTDSTARVERLVSWIRRHRHDLMNEAGEIEPRKLVTEVGNTSSYWSDVLRIPASKKSFGAKAARTAEEKLGMPPLYLEGVENDWPFEEVERDRYDRLTPVQRGMVQAAMLQAIREIEAQQAQRAATGSGDSRPFPSAPKKVSNGH